MSTLNAVLISLGICVISAILEGLFARKNVKPFFAKLKWPSYSAPLWVWYIIGVFYYVIFFFLLYRIFRDEEEATLRNASLAMVLVMMAVNAGWNYVFFRKQDLFLSFIPFAFYPFLAIALFITLLQFDTAAACALGAYLVYLVYAVSWSYRLWKLNPKT